MLSAILFLLTILLIVISVFLVLVVLAQKTKDGGMGATLGGGAVEQTFGHEGGNVLTKSTVVASVTFFILAFALYLGRIYERKHGADVAGNALPSITVPAAPKPVTTTAPLTAPTTAPATATANPAPATPATTPAPAAPKPKQ